MEIRRFIIANDHAGVELKTKIITYLADKFQIIDLGINDENSSVNYAQYAIKSVQEAIKLKCECILICGTGIGMCMAANKVQGARAANLYNVNSARLAKAHNDANVICFGAREFTFNQVKKMLDAFINATFEGQRHTNRLAFINEFENKTSKKKVY